MTTDCSLCHLRPSLEASGSPEVHHFFDLVRDWHCLRLTNSDLLETAPDESVPQSPPCPTSGSGASPPLMHSRPSITSAMIP